MAIALADVGKSVREILYGTPKEGTFVFDQKVTYSTKTADGVVRFQACAAPSAGPVRCPWCIFALGVPHRCLLASLHCPAAICMVVGTHPPDPAQHPGGKAQLRGPWLFGVMYFTLQLVLGCWQQHSNTAVSSPLAGLDPDSCAQG